MNPAPVASDPGVVIRPAVPGDEAALTRLQRDAIWWNNLSRLGDRFCNLMHRQFIESRHALVFVAERRGEIVGHIIWALDSRRFFREFLIARGWLAALVLLPKLLDRSARRTIWRSLTYYPAAPADDPIADGVAWAVAPEAQGAGVGQRLMSAVIEGCRARGIGRIKAGQVNPDQPATNAAYRRAGFVLNRCDEFYPGVMVNVYWREIELDPANRADRGLGT